MRKNAIRHITTSPYHPYSNGLAERAVQSFKEGMKKITTGSLGMRLARFLFTYRLTPHTTAGRSPAELLMGRHLRCHLDVSHPDAAKRVKQNQDRQKAGHDVHAKLRCFGAGQPVFVRMFRNNQQSWTPGLIQEARGPLSYRVQLPDGRVIRRHVDHLRRRESTLDSPRVFSPEMADSWDTLPSPLHNTYVTRKR